MSESDSIGPCSRSALEGRRPVARSLRTNMMCPSAGATKTPSSRGIGRSGSRQKLTRKAANIKHEIPKSGTRPKIGSIRAPTKRALTPIVVMINTGPWPPWAKPAMSTPTVQTRGLRRRPRMPQELRHWIRPLLILLLLVLLPVLLLLVLIQPLRLRLFLQ